MCLYCIFLGLKGIDINLYITHDDRESVFKEDVSGGPRPTEKTAWVINLTRLINH